MHPSRNQPNPCKATIAHDFEGTWVTALDSRCKRVRAIRWELDDGRRTDEVQLDGIIRTAIQPQRRHYASLTAGDHARTNWMTKVYLENMS